MRIVNQKDFCAGLLFIAFGAFFSGYGTEYKFGAAAQMGPGYFPTVLGVGLMGVGAFLALASLRLKATPSTVDKFDWSMLIHVIGGVVLFGALLTQLGLFIALFVMLLVASHASHEFTWKGGLITTVLLILLSSAIFVWGLELQFPLWPTFIVD
ncbi:MAG: tripartite tricarboxylate transporter TctB family protein [Pseudomonadota bacterium]